jgi:hypothetical protein
MYISRIMMMIMMIYIQFIQFMEGFRHSHDSITNCTAKITN